MIITTFAIRQLFALRAQTYLFHKSLQPQSTDTLSTALTSRTLELFFRISSTHRYSVLVSFFITV